MKRLHKILLTAGLGVLTMGSLQADLLQDAAAADVKKVCDVQANGLDKVLATAAMYNAEAVKLGIEFKRLGVTNSNYVKTTTEAAKAKKKEVVLEYKKKGKVKKHKARYRLCCMESM